jgi:hypothetical protein
MSFPTYADPIPTPAPLTSGTTTQSFTDPLGDVWVAKNGVRGGNWYRARDVLRCHYSRAAAFNFTNANVVLAYDTVNTGGDSYGLMAGGAFTAPVAGVYMWFLQVCGTATAAAQWFQLTGLNNGAFGWSQNRVYAVGAGNVTLSVTDSQPLNATDTIQPQIICSAASLAGVANGLLTYGFFNYMGTG